MMKQGREVAQFAITIHGQADGRFRFTGNGLNQGWESLATASFEPFSASLRIQRAEGKTYSMRLRYDGGHVSGRTVTTAARATDPAGSPAAPEESAIDATIPEGTIDQRIDWAAVLSGPLEAGHEFRFRVYDPATGVSPVVARVAAPERVRVPAGTYEAVRVVYRIEKTRGTESYEILATPGVPRMMVREDFPDGLVTELVTRTPDR